MKMPAGRTLVATARTDATLRERYMAKGAVAYRAGRPRDCVDDVQDPGSMIGGWWFAGYDRAAMLATSPLPEAAPSARSGDEGREG